MVEKSLNLRLLIAFFLILSSFPLLQAQPGTWAISAGASGREYISDVLVDDNGNTYVTGFYRDSTQFEGTKLVSMGENDIFLAKYDVNGDLEWVNSYGWFENDFSRVLTFDLDGNILLAGEFQDSTIFATDTVYSFDTLWYGAPAQTYDVYVIEVTPNGDLDRVFADGWFSSERFYDMEVDSRANRVFACTWHSFSWWEYGYWGHGFHDAMVVALDSSAVYRGIQGNNLKFKYRSHVWGNHFDEAREVEIIGDSIYVLAGMFQDTTWYEDSAAYSITNFEDDIYVVAFDTNSNYKWHVDGGSKGKDILSGMASDAMGNMYICGTFDSSLTLGGQSALGSGLLDGFVAMINSNGAVQWVTTIGGAWYDSAQDLALAANGDIIVTGNFQGEMTAGAFNLSASDSLDQNIYVLSFDNTGNPNWAWSGGGPDQEEAHAIDIDANGYIYLSGIYNGTTTFGEQNLSSVGSDDIFVFRMTSGGAVTVAPDVDAFANLTLFPNPTSHRVSVRMELDRPGQPRLDLVDMQGRTLRHWDEGKMNAGVHQRELDLQGIPAGVYFLRAENRGRTSVQKLVLMD